MEVGPPQTPQHRHWLCLSLDVRSAVDCAVIPAPEDRAFYVVLNRRPCCIFKKRTTSARPCVPAAHSARSSGSSDANTRQRVSSVIAQSRERILRNQKKKKKSDGIPASQSSHRSMLLGVLRSQKRREAANLTGSAWSKSYPTSQPGDDAMSNLKARFLWVGAGSTVLRNKSVSCATVGPRSHCSWLGRGRHLRQRASAGSGDRHLLLRLVRRRLARGLVRVVQLPASRLSGHRI